MLLSQQGGGAQHGYLFAVGYGDIGGAQGYLGLAEADVTADQPVHRAARGHVGDDCIDRGHLVRGLLEFKAGRKGVQAMTIQAEGDPLPGGPLGI